MQTITVVARTILKFATQALISTEVYLENTQYLFVSVRLKRREL